MKCMACMRTENTEQIETKVPSTTDTCMQSRVRE